MNIQSTTNAGREAAQGLSQASDKLLNSADRAIDGMRGYANRALDSVGDEAHRLQRQVDPTMDMLSSKAQKLAQQSMDMATQAKDKAQEALSRYSAQTTRYVAEQPVRSVLIAAAVGAAVALLVSAVRHRNDSRY